MANYSWQVNGTVTVEGLASSFQHGGIGPTAIDAIAQTLDAVADAEIVSLYKGLEVTVDTRAETALDIAISAIDAMANPPGGTPPDTDWDLVLASVNAALVPAEL